MVARPLGGEPPERAGFSVKPISYTIGRDSRLEVFLFADERGLSKDLAAIDTVRVSPKGARGSWPIPPVLIRSANLAAVLVTKDAREADRVSLAFLAGPPQLAK